MFIVTTSNPFYNLWFAVTGKMIGGQKVNRQTLTREEALIAHTRSNAYLFFQEKNLGSLEVGKQADLVVLRGDAVRNPVFQQQKELSMALERAHPDRFIPRYSMVMFHDDIPYSVALMRGRIQQQILDELTGDADSTTPAANADDLINSRLPPVAADQRQ